MLDARKEGGDMANWQFVWGGRL